MKFVTLYKTGAKSKEEWTVSVDEDDTGCYYEMTWGKVGGKMQTKRNYVKGKNIGRANETSPYQQAMSEATSKWKKQLDKGYSEYPDLEPAFLPMLAEKESSVKNVLEKLPFYVQPKLDGVRAFVDIDEEKVLSRKRKEFNLPYILNDSIKFLDRYFMLFAEETILDGEVYVHGMPFQEIISLVKDPSQKDAINLEYHIYDIVSDEPFEVRQSRIAQVFESLENSEINVDRLVRVQSDYVTNEDELKHTNDYYLSEGYEGSIYRLLGNGYEPDTRSKYVLKHKLFKDDEFEITGAIENEKALGQCSLVCKTADGIEFQVKMKGTTKFRESIWENHKSLIGKMLTVRYFEMTTSENPVPRFPVGISIRDYE